MNKLLVGIIVITTLIALNLESGLSQTRDRSEISIEDTWNLEDIYPTDNAWKEEKARVASQIYHVSTFKGKLSKSASKLYACLDLISQLNKEIDRLHSYAIMKSDQDIGDSRYLALKQEMTQLITDFRSKASYIEPEILTIDEKTIKKFMVEESKLKVYKLYLHNIQRMKPHKLSEKEEKILAESSLLADGPISIFRIFSNVELPYPEIKLSDDTTVKLGFRTIPEQYIRY